MYSGHDILVVRFLPHRSTWDCWHHVHLFQDDPFRRKGIEVPVVESAIRIESRSEFWYRVPCVLAHDVLRHMERVLCLGLVRQ